MAVRQEVRVNLFPFRAGAHAAADGLRRVLGVLWLADALVKIMLPFGDRPGEQSYEQTMAAETGPPGLHHVLARETSTFAAHPFLWWLPAAVELCIGAWLVARPASRRALAASAGWALIVWVAGEGMGGLFSGLSSVLGDYPGAALLYAAAAAVLFPRLPARDEAVTAAEAGVMGYWSRTGWLALWLGAAFFTALPQNGEAGWPFMLTVSQSGAPGPLRTMDTVELRWLTVSNTNILGIAAVVISLAVAFTVFLGFLPRPFLALSVLVAVVVWVGVQNLGGILSGSATDVGTGPVLILLAAAFWPAAGARRPRVRQTGNSAAVPGRPADPPETHELSDA
jgi:hypothetical protein